MQANKPSTRTLKIEGMSGNACLKSVHGTLGKVDGVTTESVKLGTATIACTESAAKEACSALSSAGYKAREVQSEDAQKETAPLVAGTSAREKAGSSTSASQGEGRAKGHTGDPRDRLPSADPISTGQYQRGTEGPGQRQQRP